MHNFGALLKYKLKNVYWNPLKNILRGRQGGLKIFGKGILLLLIFVPMVIAYSYMMWNAAPFLKGQGVEDFLLYFGFISAQILVLAFSIQGISSEFYFSNELESLIPLPLRVNHVFIAKFISVFMGELLVSFFMVFPSLIAYAKVVDTGILFWIKSVIFILLNPIFPMAMVLILISILMKIFSKSRSKNIFQTLSILFGLVLGIGINILFRSNISGGDLAKLAIGYRELLQSFSKVFVTSELTIQSLKTSGVKGLLFFTLVILVTVVIFFIFSLLSKSVYYQTLLESKVMEKRRKPINYKNGFNRNSVVMAIFLKDWKRSLRIPIFFYQAFMGIIMLLLIGVISYFSMKNIDGFSMEIIRVFVREHIWYARILSGSIIGGYLGLLSVGSGMLFSREGKNYWIHRTLPIKAEHEAFGRYLFAISTILLSAIAVAVLFQFLIFPDILFIVFVLLGTLIVASPGLCLQLLVDASHPSLNWEDPAKMGKGNYRVFFSMFGNLIFYGLMGFVSIFVWPWQGPILGGLFIFATAITVSIALFFAWVKVLKNGVELEN